MTRPASSTAPTTTSTAYTATGPHTVTRRQLSQFDKKTTFFKAKTFFFLCKKVHAPGHYFHLGRSGILENATNIKVYRITENCEKLISAGRQASLPQVLRKGEKNIVIYVTFYENKLEIRCLRPRRWLPPPDGTTGTASGENISLLLHYFPGY